MKAQHLLLVAGALLLASCSKTALETTDSTNPDFKVEMLFEHEGCTIYRFSDAGRNIYYSKCQSSSSVMWNDGGKSKYPVEVKTSYVD